MCWVVSVPIGTLTKMMLGTTHYLITIIVLRVVQALHTVVCHTKYGLVVHRQQYQQIIQQRQEQQQPVLKCTQVM